MFRKHYYEPMISPTNHRLCWGLSQIRLILLIVISFVITTMLYYLYNVRFQNIYLNENYPNISTEVNGRFHLQEVELFESDIQKFREFHSLLESSLQEAQRESSNIVEPQENKTQNIMPGEGNRTELEMILPVLVIACNRISVKRSLDQLIVYRPSKERHPIIVSQDCGHNETREAIQSYGDQLQFIQHTNLTEIDLPAKLKKFVGYYKIARHYSWALNYIFNKLGYNAVIIIEDDLNVSPDLFEYFQALYPILKADESLYCISAWNDNGKSKFVNDVEPDRLYRTDFFPGLGWMLTNKTYQEFASKWPSTFWDDWIRHPDQRKNRACIRPELPRTKTFGKIGVSNGQFYEDHLKHFVLNEKFVPFTTLNLTYLLKDTYDSNFLHDVYSSERITVSELLATNQNSSSTKKLTSDMGFRSSPKRISYNNSTEFKIIAKKVGLMPDFKAGVARTAYLGIVSIYFKNLRIYIAPPRNWTGYEEIAS